jgi:hypothetical protein
MGRNTEIRRKVINHVLRSHYRLSEDLRFATLTQIVLSAQLRISPEGENGVKSLFLTIN